MIAKQILGISFTSLEDQRKIVTPICPKDAFYKGILHIDSHLDMQKIFDYRIESQDTNHLSGASIYNSNKGQDPERALKASNQCNLSNVCFNNTIRADSSMKHIMKHIMEQIKSHSANTLVCP